MADRDLILSITGTLLDQIDQLLVIAEEPGWQHDDHGGLILGPDGRVVLSTERQEKARAIARDNLAAVRKLIGAI